MASTRKPEENQLPPDVRVVYTQLDAADLESDRTLLSKDESARAARFARDLYRGRFIAARAFLRRTPAESVGIPHAELTFGYEPHGRSFLKGCTRQPALSLSYCDDLAVVAVSWTGPLGVDLEFVRPLDDCDAIAKQMMHPRELDIFRRLPDNVRIDAFYQAWTRKEALLKAWGFGFSTEPRNFEVGFDVALDQSACEVDGTNCVIHNIMAPPGLQRRSALMPAPG